MYWMRKMSLIFGPQPRPAPMRRSMLEVRMDILKVVAEGYSKPTHIMNKSNIAWVILQKNLTSLIASGFLLQSGEGSRVEYSITAQGMAALRDYSNLVQVAGVQQVEA